MKPFWRPNVIAASILSSIIAFGGILHAAQNEKAEASPEKAESGEFRQKKREPRPFANPNRPQPAMPRRPAPKESTFLGVAAESVGPAVRAQLALHDGTGISVGHVMPHSPAEKAGIRQFDILTRLDDQVLVSGEQLQTLVRMKNPGDEIKLTLLRAAKEETITVKLGSHVFPEPIAPPRGLRVVPPGQRQGVPPAWDQHAWQEHWRQFGDQFGNQFRDQFGKGMNELLEKYGKEWGEDVRRFLDENLGDPDTWEPKIEKWLDEDIRPRVETHVRKFANVHATIVDDDGKVEITTKDGKKHVTATDPDGKVVFKGFCETDAERKKVPKDVLKKIDSVKLDVQIDALDDLKKSLPKPRKPVPKPRGGVKGGTV